MKTIPCFIIFCYALANAQTPVTSGADWMVTNLTVNSELDNPNTIIYGPDDNLWITERVGKKVVRINPTAPIPISKTVMLDLTSKVFQSVNQDGLMGMTIHPDLYTDINTTTNNYVYLVYTYDADPTSGEDIKFRIERYTYNSGTMTLDSASAFTVIEGIDAGSDHNSGKIQIGPDLKLYWTIGDFGANRNSRACNEIRSQYLPSSNSDYSDYKGKILRLNLDGSIPSDNPTLDGIKSHVYSYGHRNAQGIVFGTNGLLYSSEHGDKTDDELNIIYSGKNYGWPLIAGYNDDNGYAYCNWSNYPGTGSGTCDDYDSNSCPGSYIDESTSAASMSNFQPPIGTYNSTISSEPTGNWLSWPTVAPASINIYEAGLIPGWGKSLLIPTLKAGMILRTKLNTSGDALEDGTYEEFHSSNDRYRDITIATDGITMYTITDNNSNTNPGVVMKIEFTGTTLNKNEFNDIKLSITPNPASDIVTLNFESKNNSNYSIDIIDTLGRTINQIQMPHNSYNLNTSEVTNGIYFIMVNNKFNKKILTKKLIVKH